MQERELRGAPYETPMSLCDQAIGDARHRAFRRRQVAYASVARGGPPEDPVEFPSCTIACPVVCDRSRRGTQPAIDLTSRQDPVKIRECPLLMCLARRGDQAAHGRAEE